MSKLHYFNITYLCDSDCLFCAANIGMINHASYTISPETFEQNLLKSNVQPGERVMISGGEPTLSPYFWPILAVTMIILQAVRAIIRRPCRRFLIFLMSYLFRIRL